VGIVTLALGLAAPVTFASLLFGALRPLPVPEGHRVVRVDVTQPRDDAGTPRVGAAALSAWEEAATLSAVGGFRILSSTWIDEGGPVTRVSAAEVTPGVLPLLRVRARAGRIPGPDETEPVVLISHRLWTELYDGGPGVLGRTVEVAGRLRSVVGILPRGFRFPFQQDAWLVDPVVGTAGTEEAGLGADRLGYEVVGRLAPGASPAGATAELQGLWSRSDELRPSDERGAVVQVEGFTAGRGESGEGVAFLGLVLVGVALLLIACANVANLLLVRATERMGSLGVQAALGAGRLQISLQLLLESLLLSVAGGVLGVLLAHGMVGWVEASGSARHFGYFWMRMAVDERSLVFAGALVLATALTAGLLPVLRLRRADLQGVLKAGAGGDGVSRPGGTPGGWSRAFVTVQLALSCAALVASGLTARGMAAARSFGAGLPAAEVLVAWIHLDGDGEARTDASVEDRLLAELSRIPAVTHAALALGAPGFHEVAGPLELDGEVPDDLAGRPTVLANAVTAGFFRLFDLELRAGRPPGPSSVGEPPPAWVNESFVDRFSPGTAILGRRIRVPALDSAWATVVGVVADADLGEGPHLREDRVYLPLTRAARDPVMAVLRAPPAGGAAAGDLRAAVSEVDPRLPVTGVETLASGHRYMTRAQGILATLAAGGGAAGVVVAAVGLWGLLSFRVRRRRRELGVRMAMGAGGPRLAGEVVWGALTQLLPALVLGLALAWLAAPVLGLLLVGLDPRSPVTFGAVALGFLGVGLLAALGPALRAARVQPADVLRGE
jgi:predicted permease